MTNNTQASQQVPSGMTDALRKAVELCNRSNKLNRNVVIGRAIAPFVDALLAQSAPSNAEDAQKALHAANDYICGEGTLSRREVIALIDAALAA